LSGLTTSRAYVPDAAFKISKVSTELVVVWTLLPVLTSVQYQLYVPPKPGTLAIACPSFGVVPCAFLGELAGVDVKVTCAITLVLTKNPIIKTKIFFKKEVLLKKVLVIFFLFNLLIKIRLAESISWKWKLTIKTFLLN
jgi:hypothetical protein